MNEVFLKIINMSIMAGWLVLAVLILRLVLKKAPKWINVLLWGIVAVRLIFPFSIESALSLIPSAETIPTNMEAYADPAIDSGIDAVNSVINPVISASLTSSSAAGANPLQLWLPVALTLWILGMAALLLYTAVSCYRIRRRVSTAVLYRDNIFQSENVISPFVLGIIRPRIYLPFKMEGEDHIIAHEQAHICRKDHLWKPLGFFLLTIHWFNPLMWLAYVMLCRDIELACDEKVIQKLGNEQRADYTRALVACSVNRRMIAACPLAFGEVGVKERVKAVMNYKKPAFGVIAAAVLVCAAAAVCFLTNPRQEDFRIKIVVPAGSQEKFAYSDEDISPTRNQIIVTSGENLGDTEVILKPVEVKQENAYDEAAYLTPGMPVKLDAEKGAWFKIGVNMQNNTNEDIIVYVNVKNVEVRIAAADSVDLEQYRTDYIGDAPSVSNIAQSLAYPKDYSYSSIELQTGAEPYGLIIYLNGKDEVRQEDFESCAAIAFDLIGNMDIISFCEANSHETLASFRRAAAEPKEGSYYVSGTAAEAALNSQAYSGELQTQNYNQAPAYLNDTEGLELRIAELLDTIQASPAASSNPADYIAAHEEEYQELLSYGQYTLRYCFGEFLSGGQTDLRGHIMKAAIDDIAPEAQLRLYAETGQAYFDEWKAAAIRVGTQHDMEWIEKNQPAIYLLLQMTEE